VGKILQKNELEFFVASLMKKGPVHAPITTDMTRFATLESKEQIKDIDLLNHTFFPPKNYLLPNEEEIMTIRKGNLKESIPKLKKQFVFGARMCDLNAVRILDSLYLDDEHPDKHYAMKREATTFIGINCTKEIDEYCFCGSMDLQRDYDLLLHDRGRYYFVDVRTDKGMLLVKNLPDATDNFEPPLPKTSKVLDPKDLWPFYADKWWLDDTLQCVGCQRCTLLCPTCFCFDIKDEPGLDEGEGSRVRVIDSCHSPDFTRVAGDHHFRKSRIQRFRHRIMHKLQYYKDANEQKASMCTGCGRCIRYCHSKIDFTRTINEDFDHEKAEAKKNKNKK